MTRVDEVVQALESYHPLELDRSRRGDGGQRVLRILLDGAPAVVKCYGMKRGFLRVALRQVGSLLVVGKSSITAAARCATERAALALWRREGFDVPRLLSAPTLERAAAPCLVMEFIEGPSLSGALRDPEISGRRKEELLARFGRIWRWRHDRALSLGEPRLLMEHPSLDHVLLGGDRMVHFDLEIVFRRASDLERLVRREIAGVLCSLEKNSAEEDMAGRLHCLLGGYGETDRFKTAAGELKAYGSVPVAAWIAPFQRFSRNRRRYTDREALTGALERVCCA